MISLMRISQEPNVFMQNRLLCQVKLSLWGQRGCVGLCDGVMYNSSTAPSCTKCCWRGFKGEALSAADLDPTPPFPQSDWELARPFHSKSCQYFLSVRKRKRDSIARTLRHPVPSIPIVCCRSHRRSERKRDPIKSSQLSIVWPKNYSPLTACFSHSF